ncbi:MAG TPA: hypothetical protein VFX02_14290 [Gammaproteobacteria bacterium]|nr:hypothetical protein [Gammaproteobacteria bacterium]
MKSRLSSLILVLTVLAAGCVGMSKMVQVEKTPPPRADEVLVNFVRSSFLYRGAGIGFELWHGKRFIGTLYDHTIIQYKMSPGEHVFMANSHGTGWAYLKLKFLPGTTYYVVTNVPYLGEISMKLVPASNPEVKKWNESLQTVGIDPNQKVPPKAQKEAAAKLAEFNAGGLTW